MRIKIAVLLLAASLLPSCRVSKSNDDSTLAALNESVQQIKIIQTQNQQLSLQLSHLRSERDSLLNEIQQKNEAGAINRAELVLCKDQLSKLYLQLSEKKE